jgi:hypothetical protein
MESETFHFVMGENRFHRQVWQMTVLTALICEAKKAPSASPEVIGHHLANTLPFDIRCDVQGVLGAFHKAKMGLSIKYRATEKKHPATIASYFDFGVSELVHSSFSGLYGIAVDPFLQWIKSKSTAYESWPPMLTFARHVRNAISHGGTFSLDAENAPVGEWRGRKIGHANNREPFGNYVVSGDMIVLLYDLNELLGQLGAPPTLGWQTVEFAADGSGKFVYSTPPIDRASDA